MIVQRQSLSIVFSLHIYLVFFPFNLICCVINQSLYFEGFVSILFNLLCYKPVAWYHKTLLQNLIVWLVHWYQSGKHIPGPVMLYCSPQVLQQPQLQQGLSFVWQETYGSLLEHGRGVLIFCNSQLATTILVSHHNFPVLGINFGAHVWLMASFVIHSFQYLWS